MNEPSNRLGNTIRDDQQISAGTEVDALLSGLVETTFGPLVVLDARFHVAHVNPAFLEAFQLTTSQTRGKSLFELGNRQWDIPDLCRLLGEILPQQRVVERFRVDHDFEALGKRSDIKSD